MDWRRLSGLSWRERIHRKIADALGRQARCRADLRDARFFKRNDPSTLQPGAIVFFAALLPQFVDLSRSVARQVGILAITSVSIEFCVLLGYGALAGRMTRMAAQPRFASLTNRVAGTMLIFAAARIVWMTSA